MDKRHLNRRYIWHYFLTYSTIPLYLLFSLGIFWIGLRPLGATEEFGDMFNVLELVLIVILVLLIPYLILLALWARLVWENYTFLIGPEKIEISYGVIWKHKAAIPYGRIQNIDIHRGITARFLGLSDLQIQTAGGYLTEGGLPGLNKEEAEQLQKELLQKVQGGKQGV